MKLIHQILSARNLTDACKEVIRNKGAAGVDNMSVKQLEIYLKYNREKLADNICSGNYHAPPMRGKEIPKSNGKKRLLGIPTVVDRMLQQATARKLMNHYEFLFSEYSYGFRPQHNQHQAVAKAINIVKSNAKTPCA